LNGLALRHPPAESTWEEDAFRFWHELQALLDVPAPSHPDAGARRRANRSSDQSEARVAIADSWQHRGLLADKSVVLIGGEPREVSRQRLERGFAMRQLEWVSSKNPRRHDSLVHAIGAGGIDVVFLVKNLMSHSIQEKIVAACEEHDVGWALVDGYGAAALVRGVERFLTNRGVA
jgi:hypothetical protein